VHAREKSLVCRARTGRQISKLGRVALETLVDRQWAEDPDSSLPSGTDLIFPGGNIAPDQAAAPIHGIAERLG
jgi:hypothetical protein